MGLVYESWANVVWGQVCVLGNIGYGDVIPQTHFGRIAVIVTFFLGKMIISMLLLGMIISSKFEIEEHKAFRDMLTLDFHRRNIDNAASIITTYCLLRLIERNYMVKRYAKLGTFKALTQLQIQYGLNVRRYQMDSR
jgi:hypothetical protein